MLMAFVMLTPMSIHSRNKVGVHAASRRKFALNAWIIGTEVHGVVRSRADVYVGGQS